MHTRDMFGSYRDSPTQRELVGFIDAEVLAHVEFTHLAGGNYTGTFTPVLAGNFDFHVSVGGEPILGSPFAVRVNPGPTRPGATLITGDAIKVRDAKPGNASGESGHLVPSAIDRV